MVDRVRATLDRIRHWHTPSKGSITEARQRLGPEPLQELFRAAARPLGREGDRNAWYRGHLRVMAIDGLRLDVADTASHETVFARPGHARGAGSAYPQVRVVPLAESGTHAYVGVTSGGCRAWWCAAIRSWRQDGKALRWRGRAWLLPLPPPRG